ncbi:EmrB/QacA subfamily drug resistance transporter [Bacillus sp. 1NLA3E]|uniref:EmrB/QacA subfamily drug resistance transporter n=1 Tax=Bacillus sp. 1NLA3E TaxID=666686 RepID=UPI000247F455|nr:EmrB/QacA subfamily drug resistance transporter [Bacillus sp. 1NLA3E]AGK53802.1 EmrB/QacA subfamily drug resistance transporter [Bacillus sp. 1NLA3E]
MSLYITGYVIFGILVLARFNVLGQGIAYLAHLPQAVGSRLGTTLIYGQVIKQSTIEGINDSFIFSTVIAVVALVLAFFIKRSRPKVKLHAQPELSPKSES